METTSMDELVRRLVRELGADRVVHPADPRFAATTAVWNGVVTRAAQMSPGPRASIGLRQFHGTPTRVGADATAFGLRTPHVVIEIAAGRQPDQDHAAHRAWTDEVSAALAPHALPGGYPNFLAPDQHDQIAHAYGDNAARLLAAKERYDPRGIFTATPLPR